MLFKPTKLRIKPLFKDYGLEYPSIYERISEVVKLGRINMIIIDGKAQTGKSTLGRKICQDWDKNYITIFRVQELLEYLKKIKEYWSKGEYGKVLNRWIFFDEPQLEVDRRSYWEERNKIIQAFTSSMGFLHNHLVMALPNIKGLSDLILTNISLRISVKSFLRNNEIVRKGFVKIPLWIETKNKFAWVTVERYDIPYIEPSIEYDANKSKNFFDFQLTKWDVGLNGTPYMPKMKTVFDKRNGNINSYRQNEYSTIQ